MKNLKNNNRAVFLVLFTLLAALVSGCATTGQRAPAGPGQAAVEQPAWEIEPWEGDGLDIPLDGSNMEAWQRSLARVKAHTSEDEYDLLENAIEYMLLYDIAARGKMDVLIGRLDGMTGHDIMSQVRWRRNKPDTNPAEAEPTEADPIDG